VPTFAGSTVGADAAEADSEGGFEQAAQHTAMKTVKNFTMLQL
jgi:hypothetical protein